MTHKAPLAAAFDLPPDVPAATQRLRRPRSIYRILGPMPVAALEAMQGYGLDDGEIGRYYGVTPATVRRLRRVLTAPL